MRTRLMKTSLLTPILLALLFVAAASAIGQTPDPNTLYQITARHSGKCLEVNGGPGAVGNGALVVQRDCSNATNQQWTFTSVGAGQYKIVAKHSNKALDVFGGVFSAANDVIVEQYEYNGSANQMWSVDDLRNGYYEIIAKHSNKALEITGNLTNNGAQAKQFDNFHQPNQQWKLTPFTGSPCTQAVVPAMADSAGSSAAEVAECKNTLRSGSISWGAGTTWAPGNIDRLCNGTTNARNTISCFQSNVVALGWAAAIDRCK